MKCADDIKTFQDAVLVERVYDFLAGLDDTYDKVRNDILRSDKVPSIENVFFMVHREAQLQITMLGSGTKIGESTVAFASKNTALVSRPPGFGSSAVPPHWEKEQRRLKREQLDSKGHVAVAPTSVADITTRHSPLTATPPPTLTAISSTPTPQPLGNFGKAFHAHDTRDIGWIIDSGATDHIMYNSALFSTTLPPHRDHVLTANNVTAPVTGAGSILLTPALPLDKVLLVPSLSSNLLSVPQVTEQLNCVVLIGVNESAFQCQTCILAKSHRVSYPPSCNKQLMPFDLVHSDVRGPSLISTALGVRRFVLFVDDYTRVLHETTCPQTPQQNGVAERKNGQILAAALALLLGALVPKGFWVDDVTYAVYLLNRLPSRVLDFQTPMQATDAVILQLDVSVFMDVTFIKDEMFFSDTPKHVLQGETSSEGHSWLD
ncbi:hypothetical protein L3X38_027833 [Prunus dulcis]|uniref:Integrase catalytic domain-containing protein n=1 Tax=Prunus dulcis TaxID=3755 RepID=A0AAD4VPJ8_PRUDU|nr:hypothetical protein L3X38_027833 [Prunus dulcis]